MKRVLITREKEEGEKLKKILKSYNIEGIVFPVIKTVPIPFNSSAIYDYDVFIFPSKNAIKYFLKNTSLKFLKEKIIIAVGEKTKKVLEKYGLTEIIIPEEFSSEGVLKLIEKSISKFKDRKILIPRAKKGIDTLPEALKEKVKKIDILPVYETVLNIPENKNQVEKLFKEKKIDITIFTSPSTLENFLKVFPEDGKEYLKNTCIAVIGKTTKKAVEKKGLEVCLIPDVFTVDALVEKIKEQLS